MDPFSIAAGVVGIVAPTLHCVRRLMGDLQNIVDAPGAVKSLADDLLTIDKALTSLQTVSDSQWASLGDAVVNQSKSTMTLCTQSCDKFRAALGRWTRHSGDGKLSWQDRAVIGVFKQGQIQSMSKQLQNCNITLTSVVSIATLHSSLQQTHMAEEMMTTISTKETEVADAIIATDKQLAEVNAKLEDLCLAGQDPGESESDQACAVSQVAVEKTALSASRELLQELLSSTQAVAAKTRSGQDRIVNTFGHQNQGMQVGVSYGAISGITFSPK
ncbi:Uncharacterized protein TPAR_07000 [Tolypocladium paradoxum]|uniref:Azaphilone pigments biosynthesis cluster protein L N-terminal domain-containing protein n=1 Tax=Tolypocladium paradoxum TaxID=94208 RepID=A0A2S4KRK1_9HYPO|nr:Uncharacterized protein TPAR_07000 [Tolypocladium paradoxum]